MSIKVISLQIMSTHQYRYRPLSGPTRFRLLHIAPGSGDSPLLTELVETSLDQAGCYVALSYVWGDTEPCNPLYIGISRSGIRQSLFDALRSFRKQGIMTVWADAVCINQGDPQDRTDQVMLMRRNMRLLIKYKSICENLEATKLVGYMICSSHFTLSQVAVQAIKASHQRKT